MTAKKTTPKTAASTKKSPRQTTDRQETDEAWPLDAAAKVLADAKEPMNTKADDRTMAAKGLWTSPGGKTPHATLYSRHPAGDQREGGRGPVREDRPRPVRRQR